MTVRKVESPGNADTILEQLTPREAKVLRMRFGIALSSETGRAPFAARKVASLRDLAPEILVVQKKKSK